MRTDRSEFVTIEQGDAPGDYLRAPAYGVADTYRSQSIEYGARLINEGCDVAVHIGPNVRSIDFCHHDEDELDAQIGRWRLAIDEITPDQRIATGFIPGVTAGDAYGFRTIDADGVESPLLIDPYARAITRQKSSDETRPDTPYAIIAERSSFDWGETKRPTIHPTERVIYETHVRDITALSPDTPEEIRGTYLGLAHPAAINYLKNLGITTVELLPSQQFTTEEHLTRSGRVNHWGYNTLGFFAPHDDYASNPEATAAIDEFKTMVKALHDAEIEVVLDVVYNHTNEQGADGPVYSLRALDDQEYYTTDQNGHYLDTTGCGNMINASSPAGRALILDSLHFWAEDMQVDGFRFDLAPAMARDHHGHFNLEGSVFEDMINDPVLRDRLLIAEPWDIWGYPQGQFAAHDIAEWSAAFRDTVRGAWLRGPKSLGQLAAVMTGSFSAHQTAPTTPINFVTAHDGFTLRDLTEYNQKHNEANGEGNRDGNNDNRSFNHGVEGPTDNPHIIDERLRAVRNIMLTLMMSRGTPMMLGGDEKLHTQHGNNNAYCRMKDGSQPDIHSRQWEGLGGPEQAMQTFTTDAIRLRKTSNLGDPSVRMGPLPGSPTGEHGVDWINTQGLRMTMNDWHTSTAVGMYTSGAAGETDADSYLTYVNIGNHAVEVTLPRELAVAGDYALVAETATGEINPHNYKKTDSATIALEGLSIAVFRRLSSKLPHAAEQLTDSPQSPRGFLQSVPSVQAASLQ